MFESPTYLFEISKELWAKNKNHAGFMTFAPPHVVKVKPSSKLPKIRQYLLPQKAIVIIEGVIQSLLEQGVIGSL